MNQASPPLDRLRSEMRAWVRTQAWLLPQTIDRRVMVSYQPGMDESITREIWTEEFGLHEKYYNRLTGWLVRSVEFRLHRALWGQYWGVMAYRTVRVQPAEDHCLIAWFETRDEAALLLTKMALFGAVVRAD